LPGVKKPLKSAMLHKLKNQKVVTPCVQMLCIVSGIIDFSVHNFKILMVF